jgi:hypothetical protein
MNNQIIIGLLLIFVSILFYILINNNMEINNADSAADQPMWFRMDNFIHPEARYAKMYAQSSFNMMRLSRDEPDRRNIVHEHMKMTSFLSEKNPYELSILFTKRYFEGPNKELTRDIISLISSDCDQELYDSIEEDNRIIAKLRSYGSNAQNMHCDYFGDYGQRLIQWKDSK